MPQYKNASYAGESITLQNPYLRLDFHKRLSGWGWGEIFNEKGDLVAILDHLGEILLRDQEIPMRLEAVEARREKGVDGEKLIFSVQSLIVREKLKGTSFEGWINYPLDQHVMEGEVTLTLALDKPLISVAMRFISKGNVYARYIRGPWLKAGQDSFGAHKSDAIFPGIDWVMDGEWSSGVDWFKDPWAQRFMPHPNKVTAPMMAVSHKGTGIGMAWNPNQRATGWFNYRRHRPQPVFASPNFIDRSNNHLMGLMVPDVDTEDHENKIYADPPLELHHEQRVAFDAEIFLVKGDSLDVMVDWVKRHGMPQPPAPRWELKEALDHIVRAYTTHLWHEGKGFGNPQHEHGIGPHEPRFTSRYLELYPDTPLAKSLKEKVDWCLAQPDFRQNRRDIFQKKAEKEQLARGQKLLSYQRPDGSFPFDPDGLHYTKDDFVVARSFIEPMGLAQDTALDITILPAMELLSLAEAPGEASFRAAARKALDYCMPMQRPEGGDFWETPLHSANLLAAGHAANAYVLGYRAFGDKRYLDKAIHWMRSLLPFTHLWQPMEMPMMYNTKPCLCSSDWYFANWVRDHVQWEVLETFILSINLGIDWGVIDPAVDWHTYHRGVTTATLRWMVDHTDEKWLPHNMPWTLPLYEQGFFDDCFADTHNSTTGNYGGMVIMPDVIAVNLMAVMEY